MCGKVRFCFGGVPFILHVLSVWTIVFFVKDRRNRCRGLTLGFNCCRKPERSRGCRQSAANPGWASGDGFDRHSQYRRHRHLILVTTTKATDDLADGGLDRFSRDSTLPAQGGSRPHTALQG